ncbi:WecB/TagA/CpsF family glycosyltransferase [Sutcliffiella cohnii]|uniref:WecB/TagA/CpsF family glycosyltransferase n=1 Tax=Sutcliffiella cohnii TaxID=33932 RepID=UPI002E1CF9A0|nr:WecB/TagA/CpsF family glycosyltransferase [Sutcliffiella cohnii]
MLIDKIRLFDVDFVNSKFSEFAKVMEKHVLQKDKAYVVTGNPQIMVETFKSKSYKGCIEDATYVTADGIGVILASKVLTKKSLPERITGFDLMLHLLDFANRKKKKVYLLGAEELVLNRAIHNIKMQYPDIKLVGSHHGFFSIKNDGEKIANEISQLKPDLTFVALGAPKQETWISTYFSNFESGVFIGVGGSLDVLAGECKRAPIIWQKCHCEWLYRISQKRDKIRRIYILLLFIRKVVECWLKKLKLIGLQAIHRKV